MIFSQGRRNARLPVKAHEDAAFGVDALTQTCSSSEDPSTQPSSGAEAPEEELNQSVGTAAARMNGAPIYPQGVRRRNSLGRAHRAVSGKVRPNPSFKRTAFGGPLKSNVRPRKELANGSTSAVRLIARAIAQNTGCRRRFEFGALTQGCSQGQRGLSVLRRPAHDRIGSNARKYAALAQASTAFQRNAKLQIGFIASAARAWRFPGARLSSSAPARSRARPALVCFAIQIQSKVAARRAWPNPSFKRTCLRQAA